MCGNLEGVGRQNAREPHTHKTCLEGGHPRTSEESPDERGGSAASFSPALSSSVDPPSRLLARLSCRLIFRVALVSPAAGDSARLGSTRLGSGSGRKRQRKKAGRPHSARLGGTVVLACGPSRVRSPPPIGGGKGAPSHGLVVKRGAAPPPRLPQTPPTLPVTRRSMRWGRTREDEDIGLT